MVETICAVTTSRPLYSSGSRELVKGVQADLEAPRAEVAESGAAPEEDAPTKPEGEAVGSPSREGPSRGTAKRRRMGTLMATRAIAMKES